MKLSRVPTADLRDAVQQARAALAQVRLALEPLLVTDLTDQERKEIPRAPTRLGDAGRDTAAIARTRPELTTAASYDPDAVVEDLENHALLSGLAETLADLHQWVEDSKLVWSGEAYFQTLRLYNVARALEKTDGSLRPLVAPLEQVFATRRRARTAAEAEAPATNGADAAPVSTTETV